MKKLFFGFIILLASFALVSCEDKMKDDIGGFTELKWDTDFKMEAGRTVKVPAEGGVFVMTEKEKTPIVVGSVSESVDGAKKVLQQEDLNMDKFVDVKSGVTTRYYSSTWAKMSTKENVATIEIKPNETQSARTMVVDLWGGVSFGGEFTFEQEAKK